MKFKDHSKTTCTACGKDLNIDKNRSWKVDQNTNTLKWFAAAFNQLEHFNEVNCPECGNKFKAPEARLFGVFKSPYVLFLVIVIVDVLILGAAIIILKPK